MESSLDTTAEHIEAIGSPAAVMVPVPEEQGGGTSLRIEILAAEPAGARRRPGIHAVGQRPRVPATRPPRNVRQRERAARRRDLGAGAWTSPHALQALTALVAPGLASQVLTMPEHFDKVPGAVDVGVRVDLSTIHMPDDAPEFVVDVMDLAASGVWDAEWACCMAVPEAVPFGGSEMDFGHYPSVLPSMTGLMTVDDIQMPSGMMGGDGICWTAWPVPTPVACSECDWEQLTQQVWQASAVGPSALAALVCCFSVQLATVLASVAPQKYCD
mmetsp:Transcript_12789/g.28714  ORF Transcript_12789/g.28714 Transcript_12789/m.28714 type:complete len:272 (-) Transcript_12789:553-1368(-)